MQEKECNVSQDRALDDKKSRIPKPDKVQTSDSRYASETGTEVSGVVRLQQQVGNRAVQRLLRQRPGEQGLDREDEMASRVNRARSSGQPLDSALHKQMSEGMGHEFSGLREPTSPEADDLNRELNAKAFTAGQDIFFREGAHEPHPSESQELIAHELTHVVQQGTRAVGGGGSGMMVNPPGDTFEQEADAVAEAVVSSGAEAAAQRQAVTSQVSSRSYKRRTTPSDDHQARPQNESLIYDLTPDERENLISCIVDQRIPLTDDHDQGITLLTEFILCRRLGISNNHPDPLFCVDPEVTRAKSSFVTLRDRVVAPAFDRIPQDIARRLLEKLQGRGRRDIVRKQLQQIAETGRLSLGERTFALSAELLLALRTLARAVSAPDGRHPQIGIISLIRPRSPGHHSQGRAVDINNYQGKRIDARWPDEALEGVVAVIDNLPRGFYVMGLPRVPRRDLHDLEEYPYYFEPYSHDPPSFKMRYRNEAGEFGLPNYFLNRNLPSRRSPSRGRIEQDVDSFEDETAKGLFREAVARAQLRGTQVLYLFPDEPNHLHLSTGPTPESLRRG
jgi:hypothetical protein